LNQEQNHETPLFYLNMDANCVQKVQFSNKT